MKHRSPFECTRSFVRVHEAVVRGRDAKGALSEKGDDGTWSNGLPLNAQEALYGFMRLVV